mmetsp:Transcript_130646/g.194630  ORF Transcript_130646/g.194630 Transcript_130646/m.194630 type:complete len:287 (+) Transcript_130646:23-883(+)
MRCIENYHIHAVMGDLLAVTHQSKKTDHILQQFSLAAPKLKYRFYHQSLVAATLKDVPHVDVALRSFFEKETGYLVYHELEQKQSLRVPQTEDAFRPIFKQIVATIRQIHRRGIAHRDIRPKNILFTQETGPILRNFESAAFWDLSMNLTGVYGRKVYSAPEMITNKTYNGELADAWSLGVLLYEVLTGSLPFSNASRIEIIKGEAELKFNVPMSPLCKNFIQSILKHDPKERLHPRQMLLHPWFAQGVSRSRSHIITSSVTPELQPRRSSAPESTISHTLSEFPN